MRLRAVAPPGPDDSGRSDGPGEERGVSAVVGIVLLLAVTVLLAAVVAPLMFGTLSESGARYRTRSSPFCTRTVNRSTPG
jgi:flagellin-like protein